MVAELLGMNIQVVRRMAREGTIPAYRLPDRPVKIITAVLLIGAVLLVVFNLQRPYTLINFIFLALLLVSVQLTKKEILNYFYAIFPILMIPFFLIFLGIIPGVISGWPARKRR